MVSLCFPYGRWLFSNIVCFCKSLTAEEPCGLKCILCKDYFQAIFPLKPTNKPRWQIACSPITCVCDPRGHVYNCFPTDTKVSIFTFEKGSIQIFLLENKNVTFFRAKWQVTEHQRLAGELPLEGEQVRLKILCLNKTFFCHFATLTWSPKVGGVETNGRR